MGRGGRRSDAIAEQLVGLRLGSDEQTQQGGQAHDRMWGLTSGSSSSDPIRSVNEVSEPTTIRRAVERLLDGTIRIPGFQRQFVWEPRRAALLMDSLYKGYPVGSLLLWRTRNALKTEKKLGVFTLPDPDKDYPIDYVLDGQQRLTSLFTTFQRELDAGEADPDVWLPIYYDFEAQADAQDSAFHGAHAGSAR